MQTVNVFHRSMTMCERAYAGGPHGTVAGSRVAGHSPQLIDEHLALVESTSQPRRR